MKLSNADDPFGVATVIGGGVRIEPAADADKDAIEYLTPQEGEDFRGEVDGYVVRIAASPVENQDGLVAMTQMDMFQSCARQSNDG